MPADLLRTWSSRLETSRFVRPLLAPTATSMRRIALAGVIADAAIMSTGAAVRLSSSGLGCPDWPRCSTADVVASKNAGQTLLNTWIEFGNRLLNFPLVIITVIVFVAAWRFRPQGIMRRDLVWRPDQHVRGFQQFVDGRDRALVGGRGRLRSAAPLGDVLFGRAAAVLSDDHGLNQQVPFDLAGCRPRA